MSSHHPRTSLRQPGSSTATPNATSGSQTITESSVGPSIPIPTLHLRGAEPRQQQRRIQWAEDVVDNEGMGKKSSKVCCIYHKPHEPGDSDSESDGSSSSEEESASEPDLSRARKAGGKGRGRRRHEHEHDHGDGDGGEGKGKGEERKASPNAYERQPKNRSKKEG